MRDGQEGHVPAVMNVVLISVVIESIGVVLVNNTGSFEILFKLVKYTFLYELINLPWFCP